jgi:hypothetical protein
MNLNKKIGFLLDTGFTPKFVSRLNESKINFLFEKMSNKKENKEATTSVVKQTKMPKSEFDSLMQAGKTVTGNVSQKGSDVIITNEGEIDEDDFYTDISGGLTQEPEQEESPDYPGSNRGKSGEQESLEEKFESKAQQGLFWARCNKCKSDDCKWCKMAKEFSKSTSKKQYKNMPEKKHPEKTVKYKKKETKENFTFKDYLGKLGSTYTAEMAKQVKGTTPTFSESIFEENLENIIQENLKPTMKKRDLLKLIESEIQKKKGLNEDFYFDEKETELDEDFMMGGVDAPVITPTKPKIKPSVEPDEEEYDEPMNPDEGEDPEPQAKSDEMFDKFKKRFDMDMDRLEKTTHKPLRFKKF